MSTKFCSSSVVKKEGYGDGAVVGLVDGISDTDGWFDGSNEGIKDGPEVGLKDGTVLGSLDGFGDG